MSSSSTGSAEFFHVRMTGFTTAARPRLRSERSLGFLKRPRCGLRDEGGDLTVVDRNDHHQLLLLI
jgi:hypothetical protein